MADAWGGLSSGVVLSLMAVLWTMLWQNMQQLQLHQSVGRYLNRHARRLAAIVDPYLSITIAEHEGGRMKRSEVYEEVKAYLSGACSRRARHLRGECAKNGDHLVLSLGDREEVVDEYEGATVWWWAYSQAPQSDRAHWSRAAQQDRRFYRLFFLDKHRDLVLNSYLPHIRQEGRAVMVKNRQRKLFTNISTDFWGDDGYTRLVWSHVVFEHPSTFDTLAMDPAKKQEIMNDLDTFRKGKEYYARIGKAWKRGYLLYGPPGTGKSAMIAAMANYLDYDIYDIELTSVRTNTDLRKLFIETTSKSIIVIEDIDCSLDLTGQREGKKKKAEDKKDEKNGATPPEDPREKSRESKVTLSGLLNFIDGLWSACGGERLVVFTTNHVERLDPALIRRGRMDKHIEMSFCGFEAFKFLAKNYLRVEAHPLFDAIRELLQQVNTTPADVAENLMPKCVDDDANSCLERLVQALEKAKEEAAAKETNSQAEGNSTVDDD